MRDKIRYQYKSFKNEDSLMLNNYYLESGVLEYSSKFSSLQCIIPGMTRNVYKLEKKPRLF